MKRRHSLCKMKHFVRVHKAVAKCSCELTYVRLCLSVRSHRTVRLPPDKFPWNFWLGVFTDFFDTLRFWLNWAKSDLPSRSMYSYDDIVPRSVCVVEVVYELGPKIECLITTYQYSVFDRKSHRLREIGYNLSLRYEKKKAYNVLFNCWEDSHEFKNVDTVT
jgi:hypothetical protein